MLSRRRTLAVLLAITAGCADGATRTAEQASGSSAGTVAHIDSGGRRKSDATSISGVVVDAAGRPLERAYLAPECDSGAGRSPIVSGPDGAFLLSQMLPNDRWRFRAVGDGCAWTLTEWFAAGTADVRIVLAAEKTLPGRVVDAAGSPVGGAEVQLRIEEAESWPRAIASADGTFAVHNLGDTAGELVAFARSRGAAGRAKLVTRRAGVRAADGPVEIVLANGLAIEGGVVDEKGRALPHQGVLAIPVPRPSEDEGLDWPSAWTGDDGSFRIEGLDPGRYRLLRWYGDGGHGGTGPAFVLTGGEEVEAGASGVRLRLVIERSR